MSIDRVEKSEDGIAPNSYGLNGAIVVERGLDQAEARGSRRKLGAGRSEKSQLSCCFMNQRSCAVEATAFALHVWRPLFDKSWKLTDSKRMQ